MIEKWQIASGQIWKGPSGKTVVESEPDDLGHVRVHDEKTGAKTRVHVEFFNGKTLVERLALIPVEERSFA